MDDGHYLILGGTPLGEDQSQVVRVMKGDLIYLHDIMINCIENDETIRAFLFDTICEYVSYKRKGYKEFAEVLTHYKNKIIEENG